MKLRSSGLRLLAQGDTPQVQLPVCNVLGGSSWRRDVDQLKHVKTVSRTALRMILSARLKCFPNGSTFKRMFKRTFMPPPAHSPSILDTSGLIGKDLAAKCLPISGHVDSNTDVSLQHFSPSFQRIVGKNSSRGTLSLALKGP